jgi:hypothetical protein
MTSLAARSPRRLIVWPLVSLAQRAKVNRQIGRILQPGDSHLSLKLRTPCLTPPLGACKDESIETKPSRVVIAPGSGYRCASAASWGEAVSDTHIFLCAWRSP